MKLLAVDFGERRVGIAVSDPTGTIVAPSQVFDRKSDGEAVERVCRLAQEERAERVIVGLPLREDGTEGGFAARARSFARKLAAALTVPVELHNEHLTSVAAAGRFSRRVPADAAAAAVLLEDYLSERPR